MTTPTQNYRNLCDERHSSNQILGGFLANICQLKYLSLHQIDHRVCIDFTQKTVVIETTCQMHIYTCLLCSPAEYIAYLYYRVEDITLGMTVGQMPKDAPMHFGHITHCISTSGNIFLYVKYWDEEAITQAFNAETINSTCKLSEKGILRGIFWNFFFLDDTDELRVSPGCLEGCLLIVLVACFSVGLSSNTPSNFILLNTEINFVIFLC